MEQVEVHSNYAGRKIRIEGRNHEENVCEQVTYEKPKQDCIRFGELASKGVLKPGMTVVFNTVCSDSINLSQEMTGKQQTISCCLDRGVVVQGENGKFAILAVLKVTSPDGLVLKGRYGRANGVKAIDNVLESVYRKIKKFNEFTIEILTIKGLYSSCEDNSLAIDYFQAINTIVSATNHVLIINSSNNPIIMTPTTFEAKHLGIEPGSKEYHLYNIGINMHGDNIECYVKKAKKKTTTQLYSYRESPYNSYLEIGEGAK